MFTGLGSMLRAGVACCALVLSVAAPAFADELQIAAPGSCERRNEDNIQATFSTARRQVEQQRELIADLRSIRSEIAGQRTWWGGDPTSASSLVAAVVLRTVKTTTDLIFDLAETFVGPEACPLSALKSLAERVALGDGDNASIAVKIAQCVSKTPKTMFFETVDMLEKIKRLADNVSDTIYLTKDHDNLKNEVEGQIASLDRQIGQYEESHRQARARMEDMERELRQAIRAYCDEESAQAAENLKRVMDQTRTGASTIAARHRQVMDRVDAAREQRSSALT